MIVEGVDRHRENEIMKDRDQEEIMKGIGEAMKEIIDRMTEVMIVGGTIEKIVGMIMVDTNGKIVETVEDEEVDREHLQDPVEQIIRMIILEFD